MSCCFVAVPPPQYAICTSIFTTTSRHHVKRTCTMEDGTYVQTFLWLQSDVKIHTCVCIYLCRQEGLACTTCWIASCTVIVSVSSFRVICCGPHICDHILGVQLNIYTLLVWAVGSAVVVFTITESSSVALFCEKVPCLWH